MLDASASVFSHMLSRIQEVIFCHLVQFQTTKLVVYFNMLSGNSFELLKISLKDSMNSVVVLNGPGMKTKMQSE